MHKIKRKKGKGSTAEERFRLSKIVLKYKDVVENPKNDFVSLKIKAEAWQQITAEFNASRHNDPTNADKLRTLWRNMKSRKLIDGYLSNMKDTQNKEDNAVSRPIQQSTSNDTTVEISQLDNDTSQNCGFVDSVAESEEIEDSTVLQSQRGVEGNPDADVGNEKNERSDYLTKEAELHFKKSQYLFDLEKELGEMIKEEQQLKVELVKQQLETAKNEEKFLMKKRDLELILLRHKVINYL